MKIGSALLRPLLQGKEVIIEQADGSTIHFSLDLEDPYLKREDYRALFVMKALLNSTSQD